MSANQLIHPRRFSTPGARLPGDAEWEGKPRQHACPRCRYMGGPGHTPRELQVIARKLQNHRRAA